MAELKSFQQKGRAREFVWDLLRDEKKARFPFPPHGRIPNFENAQEAARRLFQIPFWKEVRRIKVNPDAPQRRVRILALERGIEVYMPTPRLRGGFMLLDPSKIPSKEYSKAASLSHCGRWAVQVPLEQMPQLDAIVCGSVAVTEQGSRCGKGEGYSDIEYAILRELGQPALPVATTVHDLQLVDDLPQDDTDLPLKWIVTPSRALEVDSPPEAPQGVDWDALSREDLEEMPILAELRARA